MDEFNRRDFLKQLSATVAAGFIALPYEALAFNKDRKTDGKTIKEPKPHGFVDVTDFGAVGDKVVDDTAAIRAAVKAVNTNRGGGVYFPQSPVAYRVTDTITIPHHATILKGQFKPGQNESAYHGYIGSVIYCEGANKTSFRFDHGSLSHNGGRVEDLAFITEEPTLTLLEINEFNNWEVKQCSFRGGSTGLKVSRGEDNAWNLVDNCTFYDQVDYGIEFNGGQVYVRGGKILMTSTSTGIYIDHGSALSRIIGTQFDGKNDSGIGIECFGGVNEVAHCKFEACSTGIVIDGDIGRAFMSGRGNRILGCTLSGKGAMKGIDVRAGGRNTRILAPHFIHCKTKLSDAGTDTLSWGTN